MKAIVCSFIRDESLTEIANSLKLEKIDKLPYHITFYSFDLLDHKKRGLEEIVEKFNSSAMPLIVGVRGIETTTYGTVRFSLENSNVLQEFHEKIVRGCNTIRNKDVESKANQFYHEFSKEEQKLVDLYGRPNVMQRFRPHITLGKTNSIIEKKMDISISLDNLSVYYTD